VGGKRLEAACARAIYFGDLRYRRIKDILNAALDCQPLPETPLETVRKEYAFARRPVEFFGAVQEVPS
jgi:hypothetical protein